MTPSRRFLQMIVLLAGLALVGVGFIYATQTAGHIPTWFPGYLADSSHTHSKHAIAAFLLAAACFVFAWFQGGKKASAPAGLPKQ